jgi:sugar phosphate isomerase/epimerase
MGQRLNGSCCISYIEASMHYFVNLPLSYAAREEGYLEYFLEHRLAPELGVDAVSMQELGMDWHKGTARRLREAGLACAVHLPFFDLHPGSPDRNILSATRVTLAKALEIAALYEPEHLVGHPAYQPALGLVNFETWLESSLESWTMLLGAWPEGPPLYLENVYETEPEQLSALVAGLVAVSPGERVGVCFDAGHWFSFSGGARRRDLGRWLQILGPRIRHLHLHDNDGTDDLHLGLGRGNIPWEELFSALGRLPAPLTATLEPHSEEALLASHEFFAAHPDYFVRLGKAGGESRG